MSLLNLRAKVRAVFSLQIFESAYLSIIVQLQVFERESGGDKRVLRINIVIFFQRERMILRITLCKTNAVCSLRASDYYFAHAELGGSFDDVVCAANIGLKELGVRDEHISCVGCDVLVLLLREWGWWKGKPAK